MLIDENLLRVAKEFNVEPRKLSSHVLEYIIEWQIIKQHNEEALKNPEYHRAIYREPSALIVICANAPVGYTTDKGVKIVPFGCLKD